MWYDVHYKYKRVPWWVFPSILVNRTFSNKITQQDQNPCSKVNFIYYGTFTVIRERNKKDLLRERKRHTARKRAQDADTPPPVGSLTWPPTPCRLTDLTPPPPAGPDPPPPGVDRQTKWNYYLPVVLRTRAVKWLRRDVHTAPRPITLLIPLGTVLYPFYLCPGGRTVSLTECLFTKNLCLTASPIGLFSGLNRRHVFITVSEFVKTHSVFIWIFIWPWVAFLL